MQKLDEKLKKILTKNNNDLAEMYCSCYRELSNSDFKELNEKIKQFGSLKKYISSIIDEK